MLLHDDAHAAAAGAARAVVSRLAAERGGDALPRRAEFDEHAVSPRAPADAC